MTHLTITAYPNVPLCLLDPDELKARGDTMTTEPDRADCPECLQIWEEYTESQAYGNGTHEMR